MIKTLIIDDEYRSRELLKNLLQKYCDQVEITGLAKNINEGLISMEHQNPDVVFLDIELKGESGFEFIDQVEYPDFEIIFTSAFDQYAIKAIKSNASDYLLKPIDPSELKSTINRVADKLNMPPMVRPGNSTIPLSDKDGVSYVNLKDIVRFEADGSYTTVYFNDNSKNIVSKHLKYFEKQLSNGYQFLRIHQSHLINLLYVKKYVKTDGGYIIMKDGSKVILSKRHKHDFITHMANI